MTAKSYDLIVPCRGKTTLCVDGQNLIVRVKDSEEVVPIANVQSFSLSGPKGFNCDRIIKFRTAQDSSGTVRWGWGINEAYGAERVFRVEEENADLAERLKDYVVNCFPDARENVSPGNMESVAKELHSLKELLDDGIITQEEFVAKKKQLLGI